MSVKGFITKFIDIVIIITILFEKAGYKNNINIYMQGSLHEHTGV